MKHDKDYPLKNTSKYSTHFRLSVNYDKGGMNLANYQNKPRGYYLSVGVVGIGKSESGTPWESFGLFSHSLTLLEETQRLSQKRLWVLFAQALVSVQRQNGREWELFRDKLEKDNLEIE